MNQMISELCMERQKNYINQLLSFRDNVEKEYGEDAEDIIHEVDRVIASMESIHGGHVEQLQASCKNLDDATKRLFLAVGKCSLKDH